MFSDRLRDISKKTVEIENEKHRIMVEILKAAFSGENFYEFTANVPNLDLSFLEKSKFSEVRFFGEGQHGQYLQKKLAETIDAIEEFEKYPNFLFRIENKEKLFDKSINLMEGLRNKYKANQEVFDFLTFNEYKLVDILKDRNLGPNDTIKALRNFCENNGKVAQNIFKKIESQVEEESELNESGYLRYRYLKGYQHLIEHQIEKAILLSSKFVVEFRDDTYIGDILDWSQERTDEEIGFFNHLAHGGGDEAMLDCVDFKPNFLDFCAINFFEAPNPSFLRLLETYAKNGKTAVSFEIISSEDDYVYFKDSVGNTDLHGLKLEWLGAIGEALGLKITLKEKNILCSW